MTFEGVRTKSKSNLCHNFLFKKPTNYILLLVYSVGNSNESKTDLSDNKLFNNQLICVVTFKGASTKSQSNLSHNVLFKKPINYCIWVPGR